MRSRLALTTLALSMLALVPFAAHAAAIPFFGPVIPSDFSQCALSFSAFITVINNIIRLLITLGITILAPIMIAYAGFLLVANPFNSGAKSEARSMLLHVVIGIVIALLAYAFIAAIMAVLYDASAPGLNGMSWADIINGGSIPSCLSQAGTPTSTGGINQAPAVPGGTNGSNLTVGGAPSGTTPLACLVASSGMCAASNMSIFGAAASQASTICCQESSCGSLLYGDYIAAPSKDAGQPVSFGLFQINISANPVAGLPCPSAFSSPYTGSNKVITIKDPNLYSQCKSAALDQTTNIATAYTMYQAGWKGVKPSFGAWTSATKCNIAFLNGTPLASLCALIPSYE